LSNYEVSKAIRKGERLKCPPGCPAVVWNLIAQSWSSKPVNRPTFQDFRKALAVDAKEEMEGGKKYEYGSIPAQNNNAGTVEYGRIPKNEDGNASEYGTIAAKPEESKEEEKGEEAEDPPTPGAHFDVNKVIYGHLPKNEEEREAESDEK